METYKQKNDRILGIINTYLSYHKKKANRRVVIIGSKIPIVNDNLVRLYFGKNSFSRMAVGLTDKELNLFLCGFLQGLKE